MMKTKVYKWCCQSYSKIIVIYFSCATRHNTCNENPPFFLDGDTTPLQALENLDFVRAGRWDKLNLKVIPSSEKTPFQVQAQDCAVQIEACADCFELFQRLLAHYMSAKDLLPQQQNPLATEGQPVVSMVPFTTTQAKSQIQVYLPNSVKYSLSGVSI